MEWLEELEDSMFSLAVICDDQTYVVSSDKPFSVVLGKPRSAFNPRQIQSLNEITFSLATQTQFVAGCLSGAAANSFERAPCYI